MPPTPEKKKVILNTTIKKDAEDIKLRTTQLIQNQVNLKQFLNQRLKDRLKQSNKKSPKKAENMMFLRQPSCQPMVQLVERQQ